MSIYKLAYFLSCLGTLLLVACCYNETALSFETRWNTRHEAYSHGYLLLLVCIAMGVRKWRLLAALPKQPYWPALLPLIVLSLLWLMGRIANVLIIQQAALPAIIFFTLKALLGCPTARHLRFSFALFYAAVPVWDMFNPWLQLLTVKVCTLGLRFMGIPAFIESTQITIPTGTFQVAGGCSGLNYLLMIGIIAAVYGHLYYNRVRYKILLLCVALFFGLLCNWIRVFSLVIAGYTSEMQSPLINDHEMLGWFVFALCLIPFLFIALRIETLQSERYPSPGKTRPQRIVTASWTLAAAAISLAANIGPLWLTTAITPGSVASIAQALVQQQTTLVPFAGKPEWQPCYLNSDEYTILHEPRVNPPMQIHLVTYLTQEQGKELVQWDNTIVNEERWQLLSEHSVEDGEGNSLRLASIQSKTSANQQRAEVLYWFAIGDHFTSSDLAAKFYQVLAFLKSQKSASLLAIFYKCTTQDCGPARSQALESVTVLKRNYLKARHTAKKQGAYSSPRALWRRTAPNAFDSMNWPCSPSTSSITTRPVSTPSHPSNGN